MTHTALLAMMNRPQEGAKVVKYRTIKPLIVDAIQINGPADISNSGAVSNATAGDWLIRDPYGNLQLCDDSYFKNNYTPMQDSRPIEQFRETTSKSGGC